MDSNVHGQRSSAEKGVGDLSSLLAMLDDPLLAPPPLAEGFGRLFGSVAARQVRPASGRTTS